MNILSLGAGVQSSVMALMAARGVITPMPDAAIFADTQWEPKGVYDHLDWLETQLPFPVHRITKGDIRADHIAGKHMTGGREGGIPFYGPLSDGMSFRQCTQFYKILPIKKKLRELLGLKKGQRAPKTVAVHQWIGISTDEASRMKPSRDVWVENKWPLIESNMSRSDCIGWFQSRYPGRVLAKSACIGCPYHSDLQWRDMKNHDLESWDDAVDFDNRIRKIGAIRGKKDQFVHRSGTPLSDVDLRTLEDMGQLNMFNEECEGMCGV